MNCAKRASPRAVANTPALPETPPSIARARIVDDARNGMPCHRFVGAILGSRRLGAEQQLLVETERRVKRTRHERVERLARSRGARSRREESR